MESKKELLSKDSDQIHSWAEEKVRYVSDQLHSLREKRTDLLMPLLRKVLDAFAAERVSVQHFQSLTGYGHGDQGRQVIDRIFARVLGAESAAVRLQFVSGTHAITAALFGNLRPGDSMLSVSGPPYETLEEVIGIRGVGKGSLIDFGINYEEVSLKDNGQIDFGRLKTALEVKRKLAFIQRSCGYSWRPSLNIEDIRKICLFIHSQQPDCICFVDNCYGELVELKEPCEVGADLIAGSLIKNLGGTIAPTGGYVAGREDLVENACARLTSPGIGAKGGTSFDLNRIVLQGLFLAPQMVTESLIGADIISGVFSDLGFPVMPLAGAKRGDLIQSVCLGSPEALQVICRSFQRCSPVGSYLEPVPSSMPGYENNLLMAGGTFIDGSTSEFSADAPLRHPYNLYVQGGTHHIHIKIALIDALCELVKEGVLQKPQI